MSSNIDFDKIYQEDVINALKNDTALNWPSNQDGKKLTRGTCPGCGKKELYISVNANVKMHQSAKAKMHHIYQ